MDQATKDRLALQAAAAWDWLRVHPRVVHAVGWVALGFVLGFMAGCASFDHVYWCLRSAPGTGGPFCP